MGRHFCIWRCQNKVQGPRDWGKTVGVLFDGCYALGTPRFHLLAVLRNGFLRCPACAKSEPLGAHPDPPRRCPIGLRFGYVLYDTKSCSTLILWLDWSMSAWRKVLAEICALGGVWPAFSVSGDARTGRKDPRIGEIL